ncbi:hypothetical protein [Rhizobium hidalgonense]|uniref:hypothetical protein n=1 Tax=Rhizobium hidalgonense TaxID=1538159 RepID=UPI002870F255|nr:hypothetical protein [Rhizobium hidalgonense]MDR9808474.1 hypothetical protein [Rhizobium hidalgonense]
MINPEDPADNAPEPLVHRIVTQGPQGAVAVAGIATAIVVLLWFLFYLLVFVPRSG